MTYRLACRQRLPKTTSAKARSPPREWKHERYACALQLIITLPLDGMTHLKPVGGPISFLSTFRLFSSPFFASSF